ncbi:MAG: UDP-N-acetylglucosamine 4,6-dehydratase (inverting) [Candidatus Omnitrophota bacterium]|nr:UDP-N-acetylglucosamine 4,6-dehydratase (inverting) [Candidatus Omnitrophota bacterium]
MNWKDKVVLITGGTGSFGQKFVKTMLEQYHPKKIVIFSRDELKQFEMSQRINHASVRYFIGDVRDVERLRRAFFGVDIVVHAAALKQVPSCEYNPFEAIKTNVIGAENVITAAIDRGVKKVIALSTDKAANPINLYGATKLCSDKLFIAGNAYAGDQPTRFSVVRYGNVIGSRGSVIPVFKKKRAEGMIPITDERMTRFWITLEKGVEFVIKCFDIMHGGELFIPKIPSMQILSLKRAIAPECAHTVTGIRPGEKLHEVLLPTEEAHRAIEFDDMYVVEPNFEWWKPGNHSGGKKIPEDFEYRSNTNADWLSEDELKRWLEESDASHG